MATYLYFLLRSVPEVITRFLTVDIRSAVTAILMILSRALDYNTARGALEIRFSAIPHILIPEIAVVCNNKYRVAGVINNRDIDIDVVYLSAETNQPGLTKIIEHQRLAFDRSDNIRHLKNFLIRTINPIIVLAADRIGELGEADKGEHQPPHLLAGQAIADIQFALRNRNTVELN